MKNEIEIDQTRPYLPRRSHPLAKYILRVNWPVGRELEETDPNGLGECWEVRDGVKLQKYGYPVGLRNGNGEMRSFAQFVWEAVYGRKVPKGKVVHHRCKNRKCARVSHLQLLTHKQHVREHVNERREKATLDGG